MKIFSEYVLLTSLALVNMAYFHAGPQGSFATLASKADSDGNTAAHLAADAGHVPVVQFLRERASANMEVRAHSNFRSQSNVDHVPSLRFLTVAQCGGTISACPRGRHGQLSNVQIPVGDLQCEPQHS